MSSIYSDFNSVQQMELREKGLALPEPPKVDELPAGVAQWAIPHWQTFASVFNLPSRSYRALFDEALKHSRQNSDAIDNDIVIQEALFTRKYATSQVGYHVEAIDPSNPKELKAAEKVTRALQLFTKFNDLRFSLLGGMWKGRKAAQLLCKWDYYNGEHYHYPVNFKAIDGDKLVFRYCDDVGVVVNSMYDGPLERVPTDYGGWAVFLPPELREQVVVFKYEEEDTSFFRGDMAGQIEGVGLRSRLYWTWWLKAQFLAALVTYVNRFASGIITGTYPLSDANGEAALVNSIASLANNKAFITPVHPVHGPMYGIEVKEVGTANSAFLFNFINDYFDHQMRKMILGDIERVGESGGIGGDEASAKLDSLAGIRRWDRHGPDPRSAAHDVSL
jgi:hypothetical protein